ncbi:UDP-N-acetylmuramoyl-L-alanine--D-glutamate ligase [Candidatus Saccharibacteria bacterium]|nr:UDP-N-acetylmuramoyl-L-alanine--D-glutamate ligase [Candidatus Saccharibacteria bacterium]
MQEEIANHLRNKSILVIGYSREGQSAVDFIQKYLPEAHFAVADQKQLDLPGIECFCGEDYLAHCDDFDVIIKSPGVPVKDNFSAENRAKITSCTDLFLQFCPNTTIGVTGTKGKSTTTSLVHHILTKCGKHAIIGGNIGRSVFDLFDEITPDAILVLELSCHQLEFIHKSPNIAILLNLYEEHLDHYNSAEEYYNAKKNIFRHQNSSDTLIFGDIFQHATKEEIAAAPAGQKINLATDAQIDTNKIQTQLLGAHNLINIRAAAAACEAIGLQEADILEAVKDFRGLPHRLEFVGEFNGIKFYNDSIATAQEAVINAVKTISDADTLILGGMDRGLNYTKLLDFLRTSQLSNIILLPNTAERMQRQLNEQPHDKNVIIAENMSTAVQAAYRVTAPGHSCLLSPAAASYGFYKNFEERGEVFRANVKKYATLSARSLNEA